MKETTSARLARIYAKALETDAIEDVEAFETALHIEWVWGKLIPIDTPATHQDSIDALITRRELAARKAGMLEAADLFTNMKLDEWEPQGIAQFIRAAADAIGEMGV